MDIINMRATTTGGMGADIVRALGGRRNGRTWTARCPAHEDRSPSLSLAETEDGRLLWYCHAGCSQEAVREALIARGLLERLGKCSQRTFSTPRPSAKAALLEDEAHRRRQCEKAAWLWSCRQAVAGTIAETHLRQVRGITCALPPTLGFLAPWKPEHHPALIAAFGVTYELEPGIIDAPRDVGAVHLTLLKADGSGKAELETNKLTIGSPSGVPIVLAPLNDLPGLAVTEGIEDALSVHTATGLGAWAAGTAGNMPKVAELVPDYTGAVTIYAHDDRAGRRGALELAEALHRRRIETFVEGLP